MNNKARGDSGESRAATFLVNHGHEILERNYRFGRGEVDIISLIENDLLVFTEVKLRYSNSYGEPEAFVSETQQSRIMEVAEDYINAINWKKDIRFDIISINQSSGELLQFKDAFH